ncbi:hypothetical protein D3C79_724690 [compost metagenome]
MRPCLGVDDISCLSAGNDPEIPCIRWPHVFAMSRPETVLAKLEPDLTWPARQLFQ